MNDRDRRNVKDILSEWGGEETSLVEEVALDTQQIGKEPDGSPILYHTTTLGDPDNQTLLCIALHGDEPTGIGAWWRVASEIEKNPNVLVGGIKVMIPAPGSRGRYLDGKDPNRVFYESTSAAERLAKDIYTEMDRSIFVIDLHGGGNCVPFVIVDDPVSDQDLSDAATWRVARTVGCAAIMEMNGTAGKMLQSSLVTAARRRGLPGITIELPDRASPELAFRVLHNTLVGSGVLGGELFDLGLGDVPAGPAFRRTPVYANASGYFYPTAGLGDWLNDSRPLGEVRKINGEFIDAVTFHSAYMIALDKTLGEGVTEGEMIGEVAEEE